LSHASIKRLLAFAAWAFYAGCPSRFHYFGLKGRPPPRLRQHGVSTYEGAFSAMGTQSVQFTDQLIFSHNTLEILGFAFDAVPDTPVRLDREVRNNSVDGPFAIIGAPLWSLSLMMYIVIY
jgi:hypothetical protein